MAPHASAPGWLIPEDFLDKGLPRLAPGIAAAPVPRKLTAAVPVKAEVVLEDLRYRSYPSFTRIVVEACGAGRLRVVPGGEELRVRLPA